jgi:DNA-binding transcriptional LysR family regulator
MAGNVRAAGCRVKHTFGGDLPSTVVSVELRHLRSFVVLAEELNFTRAAARLHLAQQALSAQIQQCEDRIGARLFARTTRSVELTAAGRVLLERVPKLLAELDDAVDAACRAARGETGQLTVGIAATGPLDVTPRLLREFTRERPDVAIAVRNAGFDDPTGGVATGDADVAIVWLPYDAKGVTHEVLFDDPRIAVLPRGHPLAAHDEVDATDLAREPFGWVEGLDDNYHAYWTLADHRDGPPRIGARITAFDDYFTAIRAGQAVAASPSSITRTLPWDDIELRPIRGLAPAQVAVCWREQNDNPLVAAFVDGARALAAEQR